MEVKAKSEQTRRKKVTVGYLYFAVTLFDIGVLCVGMRMSSEGVVIYMIDCFY